jgi:predicted component of type VI protein secretion system
MDLRTKLSNLRANLQGNDKLEEALLGAVGDQDKLNKLKQEMDKPAGGSNG